ncbi:MAG: 50S ribosomal protein L11 methyltransferase [Anaerolineales bacterium]|nr:50S ribosomal protein L11 methyltransferase [Anaerolineales bacterium]
MNWLELTLEVENELADDIATALMPYMEGGISITSSRIQDDASSGHPAGPMLLRAYIRGDEKLEETRDKIERALWFLGCIHPLPEPTYTWIPEREWQTSWKEHYHPIKVGERLMIIPAWENLPDPEKISILIDPGMAFGTGAHPTTRLCLVALESVLQPGDRVADLGAGSGILSIAARKLGAARVDGWDIDPGTIAVAERNAALNKVDGLHFSTGKLADLLQSPGAPYDLLLANILAHVLTDMIDKDLVTAIRPGGLIIMSGILSEQLPLILKKLELAGMSILNVLEEESWTAVVVKKLPSIK